MEKGQNSDTVKTMNDQPTCKFSSPWLFSDVVLVVEDTKFHVHKCRLSMWSPVFLTMFTSNFIERSAKEIPLPGKQAVKVLELLNVIYSTEPNKQVTESNYECLLELAQEYQMDQVVEYCKQHMSQGINQQNCLRRYKIAECFELQSVKKKCISVASWLSSTALEESPDFLELGFESKFRVCMKRVQKLEKLRKYAEICSKLVSSYYEDLERDYGMGVVPKSIQCSGKPTHHQDEKGDVKVFDSACKLCKRRIPEIYCEMYSEHAIAYNHLFAQLDDLEDDKTVAKILQQIRTSED